MNPPIRIAIVEDHAVFRKTLRLIIDTQPDLTVVAEAADGLAAIDMVDQNLPDVLLIDVSIPKIDGIEVTRRITSKLPHIKIIVLTLFDDEETKTAALQAGACYCIPKDRISELLFTALRECRLTLN